MSARHLHVRTVIVALAVFTAVAVTAGSAHADPTIDGQLGSADYGSPVATQVNPTGFGDASTGTPDFANGSELDAAYAKVAGGNLYLMLTGNLESSFNHLELFIDSVPGGQHTLVKNNVDIDFHALERMGENLDGSNASATDVIGPGLTFDAGFEADYYIGAAGGNNPYQLYVNYATLPTAGAGEAHGLDGSGTGRTVADAATGIQVAIDNSNVAGVTGADATSPTSAATGVEYLIPLAAIGNPTGPIKITAFINGTGHDFVSNQILGSLPTGYGNMAEPRTLDLSAHDGDQFFTVPLAAVHNPGDTNSDGIVDLTDLNNVLNNFGSTGTGNPGDDDSSSVVDLTDLNNVLNNFGTTYAASALSSVPEPASLALVGLAGLALVRRRRRD